MIAKSTLPRWFSVAASVLAGMAFTALLLALAALAASPAAAAARAAASGPEAAEGLSASVVITCGSSDHILTHTRYVAAWYGSLFVAGSVLTDVAELTDHLSGGLATEIFNDSQQDPRVKNNLGAWLTSTTDISWTLAPAENLSATANLRAALHVAPPPPFNAIRLDQPISRGTFVYNVVNWDTSLDCGGPIKIINNIGLAQVAYFEHNARAVRPLYLPLIPR